MRTGGLAGDTPAIMEKGIGIHVDFFAIYIFNFYMALQEYTAGVNYDNKFSEGLFEYKGYALRSGSGFGFDADSFSVAVRTENELIFYDKGTNIKAGGRGKERMFGVNYGFTLVFTNIWGKKK